MKKILTGITALLFTTLILFTGKVYGAEKITTIWDGGHIDPLYESAGIIKIAYAPGQSVFTINEVQTDMSSGFHVYPGYSGIINVYDDGNLTDSYNFTTEEVISVFPVHDGNSLNVESFRVDFEGKPYRSVAIQVGLADASVPGISGKDTIINNIDNPYTVEQIKTLAGLKAFDDYDGWITDQITIKNDGFTSNNKKVGMFTITFEVANSAGIKSEYILNVLNQDLTKPIINGPGSSTQSYTVPLDRAALINSYTVTDNYDTNLSVKIDSDNFVENKPGTYTFNLSATDSSGNKSTTTHTLTLFDDQKPTIVDSESGVIKYNWKEKITDAKLLMGLTANDEIDGVLTSSIKITNNPIKNTLGQYTVTYEVSDKAGNKTSHERTYEIVHVDAPAFWVSDKLISIEDVNKLTLDQLANVLALQNNVTIVDYQVLSDEYSDNSNTSGYYAISMNLLTSEGQTLEVASMVRVFNNSELNEPAPLTVWQKILNVITTIWNFIVNVFKWVWNLIVKIVMFIPNLLKK